MQQILKVYQYDRLVNMYRIKKIQIANIIKIYFKIFK